MKGVIFTQFFEMVEDELGFEMVDQLIENTNLSTGGAYTTVGTYDHKELLALTGLLAKLTGLSVNELLVSYGQYLFPRLTNVCPDVIERFSSCFELVAAVDDVIHPEVLKLYPDAELPTFEVVGRDTHSMKVSYKSCRPFAYLAKGLILGASNHYHEEKSVAIKANGDETLIKINDKEVEEAIC